MSPAEGEPGERRGGLGSLAARVLDTGDLEAAEPGLTDAPEVEHLVAVPGLDAATAIEAPRLAPVLSRWGAAPLVTLTALNLVDELDRAAFIVLAPDVRRAFDLSDAALGAINGLSGVLVVVLALPFAMLADRGRRRTLIAALTALTWSAFAIATGLVRNTAALTGVRFLSGLGKASVDPVHGSLLADYYPVEARGQVYAVHQGANGAGGVIGVLFSGVIAWQFGWRAAFVALGLVSTAVAIAAFRLREPPRGAQEGLQPATSDAVPAVPFGTAFLRLLSIRSLRYTYFAVGVLGFALVSAPLLLSLHLEEHLGLSELQRGVVFALLAGGAVAGVPLGKVADRLFRHDPSWPMFLTGALVVAYTVVTPIALFLPGVPAPVVLLMLSTATTPATAASVRQIVAVTAPPALRSLAFAMLGIFILLFGGFIGGIVLGGISDASSPRTALLTLIVPGVIAGLLVAYGSRFVKGDIAMVIDDLREAEQARERRSQEARNLLEVRNLDFSYGTVQVLFGIDLDVPEGEIVVLLGTNGAGKSTLLRAICGLDHPTRGSVRFDGHDITYLEAEQILGLGIAQMPGGRAVFPGLTVTENLRAGCYSFRRDRARVEAEIAEVQKIFPLLAERRDQMAATLSGGEQQMLSLAKAFLTRPRLLCIDELSLGLAPAVVEQLLGVVRAIHERGTTVIIVEQSVNVALALGTTGVFMEKGEVRFVGPAQDLLDRPDLLRSVFLEGAARR